MKSCEKKTFRPCKKKTIFYCGSRENVLKDKPKIYKDFCVACDKFYVWFYYRCVGIAREKEVSNDDAWLFAVLVKS